MTKKTLWLVLLFVFLGTLVTKIVLISMQGQSAKFLLSYLNDVGTGFFIGLCLLYWDKERSKSAQKESNQS